MMNYTILYENTDESLLERLLKIRDIEDHHDDFFNPTYEKYRQPFSAFADSDKALSRIEKAIKNNEKIMVFGDYDVDGMMSAYVLYTFFRKYVGYDNVSVRLPHRVRDGYGIKKHHIDEIKEQGCSLIITVDNGITSVDEMKHAKEIGIDCIITDHHQPLEQLPECDALINPHISENLRFKDICGAAVALKMALSYAEHHDISNNGKKQLLKEFLPFVAIATVADCMPLVDENRLIVKKGLDQINNRRHNLPKGLRMFLKHCNIKDMQTYHIGFVLGPRLNATGRMGDALDGLKSFLFSNQKKIEQQFQKMEELNTKRKNRQKEMLKRVKELINPEDNIMIAADESFHEGIVGIVAGRITQQYNKPSMIIAVDKDKGEATGSLRGPHYFSIVDMLQSADHLLERYGGHEQAGGVTVSLDKMEEFFKHCREYCAQNIPEQPPQKELVIDTPIYHDELKAKTLLQLAKLGPFGEGNKEPLLLIEEVVITETKQIGKKGGHLKLFAQKKETTFTIMWRGKADKANEIPTKDQVKVIGKIKKDTYNGGFFIDAVDIL